jgi:hypothetical protein
MCLINRKGGSKMPQVIESTTNVYQSCTDHFGQILGNRIYATVLIYSDKHEMPLEDSARKVIGSLKNMKQRATKPMSYSEALDKYELEMDAGRTYSVESALSREVKEIEFRNYNTDAWKEARAVAKYIKVVEAAQAAQDTAVDTAVEVREWVAAFMADLTDKRSAFIKLVMGKYTKGAELSTNEQALLRNRYMPRGIGYTDFLEVLTRYATVAA